MSIKHLSSPALPISSHEICASSDLTNVCFEPWGAVSSSDQGAGVAIALAHRQLRPSYLSDLVSNAVSRLLTRIGQVSPEEANPQSEDGVISRRKSLHLVASSMFIFPVTIRIKPGNTVASSQIQATCVSAMQRPVMSVSWPTPRRRVTKRR